MIRLTRVRTAAAIPAVFRGKKRIDKALTLLVAAGAERKFDSAYWKKGKDQLKAESSGKCAYCEAPTSVVAHGDVEHFRPKSVYWWLAYCYDNYLYSCQICNQKFKGDNFPLKDEVKRLIAPVLAAGATDAQKRQFVKLFAPDPLKEADGQPWAAFEAALLGEEGHLLNPYTEDPEQRFIWVEDDTLREVALKPKNNAARPFVEAAEKFYGLNRPELLAERYKTYNLLKVFRNSFESPQLPQNLKDEIADTMRAMMQDDAAFAGMCRFFVRQEWNLGI